MSRILSFYNANPLGLSSLERGILRTIGLTAGHDVICRELLDGIDPPVEVRVVRNRFPELERDPALRHPYLVQFVRDGVPDETDGFPSEGEAMAFVEQVISWNDDDGYSNPHTWPAWTDDRWELSDPPSGPPSDDDERWYLAHRLERRDVA